MRRSLLLRRRVVLPVREVVNSLMPGPARHHQESHQLGGRCRRALPRLQPHLRPRPLGGHHGRRGTVRRLQAQGLAAGRADDQPVGCGRPAPRGVDHHVLRGVLAASAGLDEAVGRRLAAAGAHRLQHVVKNGAALVPDPASEAAARLGYYQHDLTLAGGGPFRGSAGQRPPSGRTACWWLTRMRPARWRIQAAGTLDDELCAHLSGRKRESEVPPGRCRMPPAGRPVPARRNPGRPDCSRRAAFSRVPSGITASQLATASLSSRGSVLASPSPPGAAARTPEHHHLSSVPDGNGRGGNFHARGAQRIGDAYG